MFLTCGFHFRFFILYFFKFLCVERELKTLIIYCSMDKLRKKKLQLMYDKAWFNYKAHKQ